MEEKRVTVYVLQPADRPCLQLQWVDPDTGKRKTRSAGTTDPEAAKTAAGDLEYELSHGQYQEASRMTWERFREVFEDEYVAAMKPNTRDTYAASLDRFEHFCNPRRLRSITERTVSAFAAAMRKGKLRGEGGYAPVTIRVTLEYLHTALSWAAGQKLIPACPMFPEAKVPKKRPQPVPPEAFDRLLAKAPDRNMEVFLLAGWLAGLRLSEAMALEWEPTDAAPYLDLARNRIILPAEFVKAVEDQWVPLDPELRAALLSLPRQGRKVFRFTGRDGQPAKKNSVSTNISRLARKAGVKLTFHSLRKGFGCRYAGKVPAQVLQRLMRHSNASITMAYYANVDEAVEAAVLGQKPNALPNARPDTPTRPAVADDATALQDSGNSATD